jgi:enoyl-CoA hydratase/carnithine racemase
LFSTLEPKGSQAVRSLKFFNTLKTFQRPLTRLEKFKKPVVVAVHGSVHRFAFFFFLCL